MTKEYKITWENRVFKMNAEEIIKESELSEEDKNDLLMTKTIRGDFKKLKGVLKEQ